MSDSDTFPKKCPWCGSANPTWLAPCQRIGCGEATCDNCGVRVRDAAVHKGDWCKQQPGKYIEKPDEIVLDVNLPGIEIPDEKGIILNS